MRVIYEVTAIQCVTSAAHPEGALSTIDGYPKRIDSRNYPTPDGNPNGDEARALEVAQAEFYNRVSSLLLAGTSTRVMWTVTLTRADGRQIMRESRGAMPDMTPPAPQPELQPKPEEEKITAADGLHSV